jgi:hypothetical protein
MVKLQEVFEQMDINFRDIFLSYFDILVDKLQALLCLLVLEAVFAILRVGLEKAEVDVEWDVHIIHKREHLLVYQHVVEH